MRLGRRTPRCGHAGLSRFCSPIDSRLPEIRVIDASADVGWAPPPAQKTALVLDLPGPEAAFNGVALAVRGYRPVPLYNAVPLPFGEPPVDPVTGRTVAAVDVLPIMSALRQGAEQLATLDLPPDAPPAFLIDANRRSEGRDMQADEFDNRSICFTTDFPSANFLAAHGIRRVLLVQKFDAQPQPDLAHVFRRWQDGGLVLERLQLDIQAQCEPLTIGRPSWYGAMFQRALSAVGFRRAAGGFGGWVRDSPSGG